MTKETCGRCGLAHNPFGIHVPADQPFALVEAWCERSSAQVECLIAFSGSVGARDYRRLIADLQRFRSNSTHLAERGYLVRLLVTEDNTSCQEKSGAAGLR